MSSTLLEQVRAALATVNDPEIKRPITDLGMVDSVEIDDAGGVDVTVLLTVAGCPLKDTINRDVTAAVAAVDGVGDVRLTLGVMTDEQRAAAELDVAALGLRVDGMSGGPHSYAKKAGFQKEDIIVAFDGQTHSMTRSQLLAYTMQQTTAGQILPVTVLRGGVLVDLKLPTQ